MIKEKWFLREREKVETSVRELSSQMPVYAVEDYYAKEGTIHLQLYAIKRYLESLPIEYLELLEKPEWKGLSPKKEKLFLETCVGEDEIQLFLEEKEIPESHEAIRVLRTCSFVCFDANGMLMNGFNHPLAKLYYCESKLTSYILSYKSMVHKNQLLGRPKYSAHVDVGQGCCSFVFDEVSLIGVDCSSRELPYLRNNQNYQNNIDACLNYISELPEFLHLKTSA